MLVITCTYSLIQNSGPGDVHTDIKSLVEEDDDKLYSSTRPEFVKYNKTHLIATRIACNDVR